MIIYMGNANIGRGKYKIHNFDLQYDALIKRYYTISYCMNGTEIISKTTTTYDSKSLDLSFKLVCWLKRVFIAKITT